MVLQRYTVPNDHLVFPMTFIREKIETISGTGCFITRVLLANTSASAWLHVGKWYLLIDLLLNHLFSPIPIPQLLYDPNSPGPQHIFISSFSHLLTFGVCLRLGHSGTTLAFHKNGSDSYLSPQIHFSETIPIGKAEYRQDLALPSWLQMCH